MCDTTFRPGRRRLRVALLLAGVVVSAGLVPVSSRGQSSSSASFRDAHEARATTVQDADAAAARRRARIGRLVARWDSLSRDAAGADSERFAAITSDTVEAGIFVVRTSRSLRPRVVRAALDASRELQFTLDARSLAAIRDGDVSVTAYLHDGSPWRRESLLAGVRRGTASCCEVPVVSMLRPDPLPRAMRDLAIDLVSQSFDGELREWLLQSSLPLLVDPARQEDDARVELGTSESAQARACLAGADRACSTLLDLHGRPADPLLAWYSNEDYRALAERVRLAPTDGRDAPRRQRECLAGALDVCETFLQSLDRSRIPSPTLQGPRLSLLRHALALGGVGAMERLRNADGDIGARLTAASRRGEAQLLRSWRATLTDRAKASARPAAPIAVASLCWVVAVAGVGLRRTKRCR